MKFATALKIINTVAEVSCPRNSKFCQKCEENSLRSLVYVLQYLCYRIMRLFGCD